MIISSKANPAIKKIASLTEKKFRRLYGEFLVEGVKPVDECIAAGKEITSVVCTEEYASKYEGAIIVTEELFKRISTEQSPQGVLASVKIPSFSIGKPQNSCLLLDGLQDPGNLGTIIRTANASGFCEIYLVNCADPYSPKCVRASMGGIFHVKPYECSYGEAFRALEGVEFICADMDGRNIFNFRAPEKFCLCIGNEGHGLSDEVLKRATHTVSIPMRSSCESLNAAVSAAISMYVLKYVNKEKF